MCVYSLLLCILINLTYKGLFYFSVNATSAFPHFTNHQMDHRFVGFLEKGHYLPHHCKFPYYGTLHSIYRKQALD